MGGDSGSHAAPGWKTEEKTGLAALLSGVMMQWWCVRMGRVAGVAINGIEKAPRGIGYCITSHLGI